MRVKARGSQQPNLPLVCAQGPNRATEPGGSVNSTEKKLSKSQQLKKVFQEYGAVGVSLHIGISLVSLGIFYTVVSRYDFQWCSLCLWLDVVAHRCECRGGGGGLSLQVPG